MDAKGNSVLLPEGENEFEVLISRFQMIVNESKDISDALYDKANKLSAYELNCDQEKSSVYEGAGDIIKRLNELADKLVFINRRNTEIYQHFHKLI